MKSKRFVKWFSRSVELLWAIALIWMFHRSFEYIFEHNTLISNREYAKHMDYLIHAKNADGTPLLSGVTLYLMAGIAVPCGYAALWLHRLDKWFEIRRLKKKHGEELKSVEMLIPTLATGN